MFDNLKRKFQKRSLSTYFNKNLAALNGRTKTLNVASQIARDKMNRVKSSFRMVGCFNNETSIIRFNELPSMETMVANVPAVTDWTSEYTNEVSFGYHPKPNLR